MLIAACAGLVACGADETDELLSLVPGLSPELARHLVRSDDETLAAFGLEYGYHNLGEVWHLIGAYNLTSDDEAAAVDRVIAPVMARLPVAYRGYPSAGHVREWVQEWRALAPARKRDMARLAERLVALQDIEDVRAREDLLIELFECYRAYPRLLDSGQVYAAYIDLLIAGGRRDEVAPIFQCAIRTARANGHHTSACHLLGAQGTFLGQQGDLDGALESYYAGLEIARHCLPDQEARLLTFIGNYYRFRGRFTMAHELFRSAEDASRYPGGRGNAIRYFLETLHLHAYLGYWDLVGDGLQRFEVLVRTGRRYIARDVDAWSRRVALIRAYHYAATGDLERAALELKIIRAQIGKTPPRQEMERLLHAWSEILIHAGRHLDARPLVLEGIERSEAESVVEWLPRFYLNRARIEFHLQNRTACREALDQFVRVDVANFARDTDRIRHDVLRAQLAVADGDVAACSRWLRSAAERSQRVLDASETFPSEYFGGAFAALRGFLRTRVECDPVAGFALELFLRRPHEAVKGSGSNGNGRPPLAICADIAVGNGAWRSQVARHLEDLEALGATHYVYAVTDHDVIRWTARDGSVTRDELNVTPERLTELMDRARAELLKPAGGERAALHELSLLLLPGVVRDGPDDGPSLLLISPEGPLADLPFEALPLSGDAYEPLIRRCDVAYVRGLPEAAARASNDGGLVIADPVAAPALKRRYPGLGRPLDHGREEAAHVARLDRSARLLERENATENAVFDTWTRARYIYVAAHVLRDPELPYMSFIPMSPEPGNERHESQFIDVTDIRRADLSRCELVVLSGCSTGSGHQDHRARAPALSDAFLDAGCGAVVQTLWDVGDREAAAIMRDFVTAWAAEGVPPLRALNKIRRQWLEAGAEPSVWAAYAITLRRL